MSINVTVTESPVRVTIRPNETPITTNPNIENVSVTDNVTQVSVNASTDRVTTVSVPGVQGPPGDNGAAGANGQGVPTGGAAGQVLEKIDGTDYNTHWVDPSAAISTDTGWNITGAFSTRKTFDPTNYTQQQLVDIVCTLINLLKTQTLPGA